jgi:hypothetical protein
MDLNLDMNDETDRTLAAAISTLTLAVALLIARTQPADRDASFLQVMKDAIAGSSLRYPPGSRAEQPEQALQNLADQRARGEQLVALLRANLQALRGG